jgi:general secretion pathway protein C
MSNRAAFEQGAAQLEVYIQRLGAFLNRVPLERWQFIAMLILVIWLSHSAARLFWLLIPDPKIPPAKVEFITTTSSAGSVAVMGVDINQLKSLTPFGQATVVTDTKPASTDGIEANASISQLDLQLKGVLASNDEAAARAIIVSAGRAEVYAVGEVLPVGNNVKLAKILDMRIIVDNNGNFESVWLYQEDPNAPQLGTAYTPTGAATANNYNSGYGGSGYNPDEYQPPQPGGPSSPSAAGYSPGVQAGVQPRSVAGIGGQGIEEMGKTLADVVSMAIHREGGQVIGYKISPGRNAELFNSLGLQAGDIVTSVNGVPLSTPGKIMEIYKSMNTATSANLEIRRSGGTVNLDIALK